MLLAGSAVVWIIVLAVAVLTIAGIWMTYVKADQPGWASIIPFYNIYVMLKIVGRPGWWLILFFIPFVNIIVGIMVYIELSRSFGHGVGFAIGLYFLPFIFWLILGFGEDRYLGPAAASGQ